MHTWYYGHKSVQYMSTISFYEKEEEKKYTQMGYIYILSPDDDEIYLYVNSSTKDWIKALGVEKLKNDCKNET